MSGVSKREKRKKTTKRVRSTTKRTFGSLFTKKDSGSKSLRERRKKPISGGAGGGDDVKHLFPFKKGVVLPEHNVPKTSRQKEVYEAFVKDTIKLGVEGLLQQYNELKSYVTTQLRRDVFDANPTKNRYKDVVCNDLTRVVLNDGREGDYIHANYVHGLSSPFILTQGPMPATAFDFWRMVMQEKAGLICMLCETVEYCKEKCTQYWPLAVGQTLTFGDITVTSKLRNIEDSHITKTLLLVESSNGSRHSVRHMHCKTWPDKTVPTSNMSILRLLYHLRQCDSTVVVHCSAGIGRTGTLVAVELCLQTLHDEKFLSILDVCKALRNYRVSCVQVDVQFLAVAEIVADFGYVMKYWDDADLYENYQLLKLNIANFVTTKGPEAAPVLMKPLVETENPAPMKTKAEENMNNMNNNMNGNEAPKKTEDEEGSAFKQQRSNKEDGQVPPTAINSEPKLVAAKIPGATSAGPASLPPLPIGLSPPAIINRPSPVGRGPVTMPPVGVVPTMPAPVAGLSVLGAAPKGPVPVPAVVPAAAAPPAAPVPPATTAPKPLPAPVAVVPKPAVPAAVIPAPPPQQQQPAPVKPPMPTPPPPAAVAAATGAQNAAIKKNPQLTSLPKKSTLGPQKNKESAELPGNARPRADKPKNGKDLRSLYL